MENGKNSIHPLNNDIGLTKREYFAIQIFTKICERPTDRNDGNNDAASAVYLAELLLKELDK